MLGETKSKVRSFKLANLLFPTRGQCLGLITIIVSATNALSIGWLHAAIIEIYLGTNGPND
jgi:hypothetical protein